MGGGTGENGDRMFPRANCISLFLDSIDNVCLVRLFGSSNFHGVTSLILVVDEERERVEVKKALIKFFNDTIGESNYQIFAEKVVKIRVIFP